MDSFFLFVLVAVCAAPVLGAVVGMVLHNRARYTAAHRASLVVGNLGRQVRADRSAQWRNEAHVIRAGLAR